MENTNTTGSAKKILLVEDEPFLSGMYQTKLKLEGFDIEAAKDGEEALEKIKVGEFGLILLDIMMPKLNGFEVLKSIRKDKDPEIAKVPVLMLTNLGQKSDVEQGLLLGANDYIIKANFTPAEVVDKINKFLV
ncbi:MAG: two component transcriptional regulator, winged helix family [Candidatus Doudnabacteria bacterium]|nr:two component transcriptional regulator, winged helix family [Candidatus Doudnabacteria bacterium]